MKNRRRVETFPLSRISTFDVGVISRKKHHITGLLEVDVTDARARLRSIRRAGSPVSFTAWFVKTVALSIQDMAQVHGVLRGQRRRTIFQDVDISLVVEREVNGTPVPLPVVVRNCNTTSIEGIETSIASAINQEIDGSRDYQLDKKRSPFITALYYRLPQFQRVGIIQRILKNPDIRKKMMGTVIVTSVAPGLQFPGWILPRSMHNLAFGLGSVVRKPRVVHDEVKPRDVLHLTVLFDHDVVDGAPAARFVSYLVKNLETATVLPNS